MTPEQMQERKIMTSDVLANTKAEYNVWREVRARSHDERARRNYGEMLGLTEEKVRRLGIECSALADLHRDVTGASS
jgi:hypothetical protein